MRRVVKVEVEPDLREGRVARRIVLAALEDNHTNSDEIADVELVTAELVTNAVEASTCNGCVQLSLELCDDDLRLSVANQGLEFERPVVTSGRPSDLRGRGLSIVNAIGDLTVQHDDGTTTVSVDVPLSRKDTSANRVAGDGSGRTPEHGPTERPR